jgi:hypothetical protein
MKTLRIGIIDGIETTQDIDGKLLWSEYPKWKPVDHRDCDYIVKILREDYSPLNYIANYYSENKTIDGVILPEGFYLAHKNASLDNYFKKGLKLYWLALCSIPHDGIIFQKEQYGGKVSSMLTGGLY